MSFAIECSVQTPVLEGVDGRTYTIAVGIPDLPPLYTTTVHVQYGSALEAERFAQREAMRQFSARLGALLQLSLRPARDLG